MEQIVNIKNLLRRIFRKYDEAITPILRFVWTLTVFISMDKLYGYSELLSRKEVILLLAILTAVLPEGFLFFIVGVVVAVHTFSAAFEAGVVFFVLYLVIYVVYVRFFPKYSYVVFLVPICFMLNIEYALPLVVAVVAGLGGAVPAACGVVFYEYALCVRDVVDKIDVKSPDDEVEAFRTLTDFLVHNKEMMLTAMVFAATVAIISLMLKFSFKYSMYIAIGLGFLFNFLFAYVFGSVLGVEADMSKVFLGAIIGLVVALLIRFAQGMLDYKHIQRVQYEDDDYYYYVKAVPKVDSEKKHNQNKSGKKPVKKAPKQHRRPDMPPMANDVPPMQNDMPPMQENMHPSMPPMQGDYDN